MEKPIKIDDSEYYRLTDPTHGFFMPTFIIWFGWLESVPRVISKYLETCDYYPKWDHKTTTWESPISMGIFLDHLRWTSYDFPQFQGFFGISSGPSFAKARPALEATKHVAMWRTWRWQRLVEFYGENGWEHLGIHPKVAARFLSFNFLKIAVTKQVYVIYETYLIY